MIFGSEETNGFVSDVHHIVVTVTAVAERATFVKVHLAAADVSDL